MRRVVLCVGLGLIAGCQGPYGPFSTYGPTQVPPPPTGTANRPDPYYRSALPTDDRVSRRWFHSDAQENARSTSREPAFSDEPRGGLPNPVPNATDYRPTQQAPNVRTAPEFDDSAADLRPLRDGTNLDWRSPEPDAGSSFVEPATGSVSGLPRPRFNY